MRCQFKSVCCNLEGAFEVKDSKKEKRQKRVMQVVVVMVIVAVVITYSITFVGSFLG